ncbi:MAG: aminoglycoside phosphotransferase family protein [Planctomycetaceae bacterium]
MSVTPPEVRLASVLHTFDLPLLEAHAVGGGFSGARVWRVRTATEQWVAVRCSESINEESLERSIAISRWMSFARDHGCDWAPEVWKVKFARRAAAAGDYLLLQPDGVWKVESWMPGHSVPAAPSPTRLQSAFAMLQQLHQTARSWALDETSALGVPGNGGLRIASGTSPGLQRRLQIVQSLQSGELARLLATAAEDPDSDFRCLAEQLGRALKQRLTGLAAQLEDLAPRSFILQPVLRDLWYPHVLFSGDNVTGVIDWNAAATDHPAFDYSRLLASWYGQQAIHRLPEHWTGLDCRLFQVCLDATLLLSPVTWLSRRCSKAVSKTAFNPQVMERFRRLVELATHIPVLS